MLRPYTETIHDRLRQVAFWASHGKGAWMRSANPRARFFSICARAAASTSSSSSSPTCWCAERARVPMRMRECARAVQDRVSEACPRAELPAFRFYEVSYGPI